MKTLRILFSLLIVVAFALTSCDKEEEQEAVPMPKAKLTGFVWADLDLNEAGLEYAPSGTKILVWVDTEDLFIDPNAVITYPRKYYEATVGADGKYSIDIEVGNNPVTAVIAPGDFWYDQLINPTDTETKRYSMAPVTVTLLQKQTKIQDLVFL